MATGMATDAPLQTFSIVNLADPARWDAFVNAHPDAHLLQTSDWGRFQAEFGWQTQIVAVESQGAIVAGALLLFYRLPAGIVTRGYIPAGPLFADPDPQHPANRQLWSAIDRAARQHRAIFISVEPCNWYHPRPDLPAQLMAAGLELSPQSIQPPRTVVLDLTPDEDSVLKRMNQSTRRKVKMGEKNEIDVREGTAADVPSFNALREVTGDRNEFSVHPPHYYQRAYEIFAPGERCVLLLASHAERDLAGLMIFRCGQNAYYLYGASSNEERNRMPTYIAQLAAIRWATAHDAIRYDMWGVPDAEPEQLEAEFEQRRDGLWGVYGFKRGFGGEVVRSVGAWDRVYHPLLYRLYRWYSERRRARSQAAPEPAPTQEE